MNWLAFSPSQCLQPFLCRAILWATVGSSSIGTLGTNFAEIQILIPTNYTEKARLSTKVWPFWSRWVNRDIVVWGSWFVRRKTTPMPISPWRCFAALDELPCGFFWCDNFEVGVSNPQWTMPKKLYDVSASLMWNLHIICNWKYVARWVILLVATKKRGHKNSFGELPKCSNPLRLLMLLLLSNDNIKKSVCFSLFLESCDLSTGIHMM